MGWHRTDRQTGKGKRVLGPTNGWSDGYCDAEKEVERALTGIERQEGVMGMREIGRWMRCALNRVQ
jgi:hypothetical protein